MKLTGELDKKDFLEAIEALDHALKVSVKMVVGGGGAMLLAHDFPLSTFDIDAIPYQTELSLGDIDKCVKEVAAQRKISSSWLNPYFSNFTYVLPSDYQKRLIQIFKGKKLELSALSKQDLLILKCFAGREKDIGHARALMKKLDSKQLEYVEEHIEKLIEQQIPKAQKALDFLIEIKETLGK